MKWIYGNPENPGTYIVMTVTPMGKMNALSANWNGNTWNFTNQLFVKYLKEN